MWYRFPEGVHAKIYRQEEIAMKFYQEKSSGEILIGEGGIPAEAGMAELLPNTTDASGE